jgi:hypothetical protein
LDGTIVSVMLEARHRGAVASHATVTGALTAHGVAHGRFACEEASVVYSPHALVFVCELDVGK